MKITDKVHGKIFIIGLAGKIVGGDDSTLFHGKVHEYVDAGYKKLVIDMAKVPWMNSIGFGMLTGALKVMREAGGDVKIANPSDKIKDLLSLMQLLRVFKCYDSVEKAIESF